MRPHLDWPTVKARLVSLLSPWRWKSRSGQPKRRSTRFEVLEARRVFAAAIWHNVLQPFNVNDDSSGTVSPIDALLIINELNTSTYRDPRTGLLPTTLPEGVSAPRVDTSCDDRATALDALLVINAINTGSADPGWTLAQSNPASSTSGRVVSASCSPKLIEGDSLFTELTQTITLPDSSSSIRVSFEAPQFDSSSQQTMRDAFEIALLDISGQPLTFPFAAGQEASFNWSEDQSPIAGPGAQSITQPTGSISTATFNLAGMPAGTMVQVVTRLVNNDGDENSSVVLRRVETIASTTPAPFGMASASQSNASVTESGIDRSLLVDVTSSVDWNFGRSSLSDDHTVLTTDVQVQNHNAAAISGKLLLVVENLSDPNVVLSQPDGYLDFGQPYFILDSDSSSGWLASGESTHSRALNFRNLAKEQFELNLRVLAHRNSAPTGFTSQPLGEIEAGRRYSSAAQASDPDQQTLRYSKVSGPSALTIDSTTGGIEWLTQASDVGNHSVIIRATDPFGLAVDLAYTIAVRSSVENRPPVITSTPGTNAVAGRPFEVVTLATGSSPVATAVGNFGSSGTNSFASLFTADAGVDALSWLASSGKEQFASAKPVSIGEPDPDKYGTPFVTAASVDLGFLPGTYSNKERNVLSLVTEDFNRDGNPDFAVSINTEISNPGPADVGSIGVRLGNGDGTFRTGWQVQLPPVLIGTIAQSSRADSIRIADVTSDGLVDFVAVQSWGNRILVYAGQGDGSFANEPIASQPVSAYGYASQLGDMNGDGKLDLVTFENQDSRYRFGLTVRLGDGAGRFGEGVFYPDQDNSGGEGYLADVNGDGALDTVRLNAALSRVEVRLNNGSGTLGDFKFSRTFFIQANNFNGNQNSPLSAYLDDYDGDNRIDVLVSTYTSNFFLLKGNNDGTFGNGTEDGNRLIAVNTNSNYGGELQFFPSAGRNDGRAPDLNGDGAPDFVFGNQQSPELTTAINDGTGRFTTNVYLSGFSDDGGDGSVRGINATPFINVADYNRDGVSDVLLGRSQTADRIGGVGIALGDKAAGALRLPKANFVQGDLVIQPGNGSSALGDFNEDGIEDVATLSSSRIYVAAGLGDGRLGAMKEGFFAGPFAVNGPLIVDDFDLDGHLDLATGTGVVMLGLGNGTFQAMPRLSMPAGYFSPQTTASLQGIASGDVNGDGYPDLIYRLPNNHSNFATETILAVFLYRPAERNFLALTDNENIFSMPRRAVFYNDGPVGFEDLNGDGQRELFAHSISIVENSQTLVPERISIWEPTFNAFATDASQLFTRRVLVNPGLGPSEKGEYDAVNALFVTDLNHDSRPDLVLGARDGSITTSFGNGDFTFGQPITYNTNQSSGFRMLDSNGDGLLDIVPLWSSFFNYNTLNNTGVLLARADGTFGDYQGLSMYGYDLGDVVAGDFNGDGFGDLNYSYHNATRLTVLSRGTGVSDVATGDLNGDGKLDVAALHTSFDRVKILLGDGNQGFQRLQDLFTDINPVDLLLSDINSDGKLDILTANAAGQSISLMLNDGSGNFVRSDIQLDQQPSQLSVGDLNGDGRSDIIVISATSQTLSWLKGLASGFDAAVTIPLGFAPYDLAVADLTNDGKLDVVLSDRDGRRLVTLPGLGNGGLGAPLVQPLSTQPGSIALSDLNADGRLDVIVTFPDDDQAGILFGRGGGRLTNPQFISVGANPVAVSIADVNDDQLPDVVVTNRDDNTISVILNRFDPASVYRYQLTATDPDADPVTFDMLSAPGGAIYEDSTQTILWAPMPDQVGPHAWVVQASDGRGGEAQQGFTVLVTAPVAQNQPQFTSEPIASVAADQIYTYQPRVQLAADQSSGVAPNSAESTARFSLLNAPDGASIDPLTGQIVWDPRAFGLSLGVRASLNFPNRFESRADIIATGTSALNATSFTAEGWYRFDALDGIVSLFKKEHSGVPFSNSAYSSWNLQSFFGTLRLEAGDFKGAVDLRLDTIRLTTNTWMHIAVTYDGASRLATIYVNGQAVGSATAAAPLEFTNGVLRTQGIIGTVSQMRMWNMSRSAAQVQQDMLTDVPSNSTGLILDYRFKEGPDAFTIQDASPLANHGRLSINAPYMQYNFPPRIPAIGFAGSQAFTIGLDDGHGGTSTQSFTVQVVSPPSRLIRGTVFIDNNGNGVHEAATESGLPGQTVYVDRNQNRQLDTDELSAITDAAGNYSLPVIGSEAIVALVSTAGYVQTLPSAPARRLNLLSDVLEAIVFGVKSTADTGPEFSSTPPTVATATGRLRYQAFAQTTDGSPIVYSLISPPAGMSIDENSGLLQWSPGMTDAGSAEVLIKAVDGQGRLDIQRFTLSVSVNTAPIVTSRLPSTASVNVPYQVTVTAQDAEQSQLTYTLVAAPSGMTLDAAIGNLSWTPTAVQLGPQSIRLSVSDGQGGVTEQVIDVQVIPTATNRSPGLTSATLTTQVGQPLRTQVSATDADHDRLTYRLISGPTGMTITADGWLSWNPSSLGSFNPRIEVSDGRGGIAVADFPVNVVSTLKIEPPRFTSQPPTIAIAKSLYVYDAVATKALRYELLSAPIGMSIDPARGFVRWQPTADQLGSSNIQLRAIDAHGSASEQTFTLNVIGSALSPAISSTPLTSGSVGATYVYQVTVNNPSANPLTFALLEQPAGMTVDAQTGIIQWTPGATQAGRQRVIVRVSDGLGNYVTQAFSVLVAGSSSNLPPIATSTPPLDAVVASPYEYRLIANDPDSSGNTGLSYSLLTGPVGMTVNSTTGDVTWTPITNQIGNVVVVLRAMDPAGGAAVQSFIVDVRAANLAPTIVSAAPTSVPQGGLFQYDVIANDADREPLFFQLLAAPAGTTIDALGRIRWQTALNTPTGAQEFNVRVADGRGSAVTQAFTVNVVADTQPPKVSIVIGYNGVLFPWTKEPAVVKVQATDNVAVTNIALTVDGQPVALRSDGTADVYFSGAGNGRLIATAFDPAGNRGLTTSKINMCSGEEACIPDGVNTLPQVAITNIREGDVVSGFVDIIGTASATDFDSFDLSVRRADQATFTRLTSSKTAVVGGLLARWDTSLLDNDSYVLKLEARDIFGGYAAIEQLVGVSGNLKLGNFRLSFPDISVPVAGVPITLVRTYDTLRSATSGEFGFGWRMEFRDTNLRTSLTRSGLEDLGIYRAFQPGTKVYLTLPGGVREGYTFTPDIRVLPGFGGNLVIATPRFTPDRASVNTLTVRGGSFLVNDAGELMGAGGQPYNPAAEEFGGGYTLVTPEGLRYFIDGNTGKLNTVTDPNGKSIAFTENGISGGGVSLTFQRDIKGRITRVTDPAGHTIDYRYDARGDLVRVTDRDGRITQFTYKTTPAHYLDTVIDPLGRTGVKVNYDTNGRLTQLQNPDGTSSRAQYDLEDSQVVQLDPLGRPKTFGYDQRGNVVLVQDALGNTQHFRYDANDNLLAETNELGQTITYQRDALGNPLSIIDALGFTTRITYDRFGNPIKTIDPLGNETTTTYDNRGNMLAAIDEVGAQITFGLDSSGEVRNFALATGANFLADLNSTGRPTRTVDWNGSISQIKVDNLGRNLSVQRKVTTSQGTVDAKSTSVYSANGLLLSRTAIDGGVTRYEYDAMGMLTALIDPLGRRTEYQYDSFGNVTQTKFPDGTSIVNLYNAASELVQTTDQSGRITRFVYDVIGQLVETQFPDATPLNLADNPRIRMEYDAAGQLVRTIDEAGRTTSYVYNELGQQTEVRNALNHTFRYVYDAAGRRIAAVDPLGRRTDFRLDAAGRVSEIVYPDGSSLKYVRDLSGRILQSVDENGIATSNSYTASNLLQQVTDGNGHTYQYAYDDRGLLISSTDALSRTTRFAYDIAGNQIQRILPGGQSYKSTYDLVGNVTSSTDANGLTTHFEYDALNRITKRSTSSQDAVTLAYTPTGQIASHVDQRGTTTFQYDERDRLVRRQEPDGAVIAYSYDASGRRTGITTAAGTTRSTYDSVGRLSSVIDVDGGTTAYQYDAASRLTTTTYANQLVESYEYDQRDRVTRQTVRRDGQVVSDLTYRLDATGRLLEKSDGTNVNQYRYDRAYRLIQEVFIVAGNTRTTNYGYDAVGNRLSRADTIDGTTIYQYDFNDRLQRETKNGVATNYTWDSNGNLLTKSNPQQNVTHQWTSQNRLQSVTIATGSQTHTSEFVYDALGERVSVTTDGQQTRYLNDTGSGLARVSVEYRADGSVIANTTSGHGLISEKRNGNRHIYLADRLGNIVGVTDTAGLISDRLLYDAYGQLIAESNSEAGPYRFTGEARLSTTGYDYLRARYYDPSTGRFLSADPFAGALARPISLHKYQYADLDPVNRIDPTGNFSLSLTETGFVNGIVNTLQRVETFYNRARAVQRASDMIAAAEATRMLGMTAIAMFQNLTVEPLVNFKTNTLPYLAIAGPQTDIRSSLPGAIWKRSVVRTKVSSKGVLTNTAMTFAALSSKTEGRTVGSTSRFATNSAETKFEFDVGFGPNGLELASISGSISSGREYVYERYMVKVLTVKFKLGVGGTLNSDGTGKVGVKLGMDLEIGGFTFQLDIIPGIIDVATKKF